MPGDLGIRAVESAISSSADGNTILVATFGTHAINPNIRPSLGYDPVRDFSPICLATRSPLVLGTRLSLEAGHVEELVRVASQRELTFGSSGVGSAPYLAALLFQETMGVKMAYRSYADTRNLYDDLERGALDLCFNNAASMLPLVRAERLRGLAVTTSQRCGALPEVPTVVEATNQPYALDNWLGFVAPRNTPMSVVTTLNRAIVKALEAPKIQAALAMYGIEIVASTPAEFSKYISAEMKKWEWLRNIEEAGRVK
jgi:tripartite-type tricarboxylate transporter receptor subunit TctC